MGNATFKILVSLAGSGAISFLAFVLLEALLSRAQTASSGAVLFRFQLSSMVGMGLFAGLAIVIYVRLSRDRSNLRK